MYELSTLLHEVFSIVSMGFAFFRADSCYQRYMCACTSKHAHEVVSIIVAYGVRQASGSLSMLRIHRGHTYFFCVGPFCVSSGKQGIERNLRGC